MLPVSREQELFKACNRFWKILPPESYPEMIFGVFENISRHQQNVGPGYKLLAKGFDILSEQPRKGDRTRPGPDPGEFLDVMGEEAV